MRFDNCMYFVFYTIVFYFEVPHNMLHNRQSFRYWSRFECYSLPLKWKDIKYT